MGRAKIKNRTTPTIKRRLRICRIATVPFFFQNHLREQICATVAAGHEVTLVSSSGQEVSLLTGIPGIRFYHVEIPRKISLKHDLLALWELFKLFHRERYDIVHSATPKAGMLTAMAAYLARIPVRLHTFTGQPWMEMHGILRYVAKIGDKVTASLNTQCYADSFSQREFIIEEQVATSKQIRVIGAGSLAGVDLHRFNPEAWATRKDSILADLGINPGAKVITFIGRLTKDKGIDELVMAFVSLRNSGLECVLLLVGPKETDWSRLSINVRYIIENNSGIHCVGYSSEPERYLAVTDIFCLPSYREGFGNVVIEAAAMGVPSVGTDIVGLRDAVVDGVTGLLVAPKDVDALIKGLEKLLDNPQMRLEMSQRAISRVRHEFDSTIVSAEILNEYDRLARRYLEWSLP